MDGEMAGNPMRPRRSGLRYEQSEAGGEYGLARRAAALEGVLTQAQVQRPGRGDGRHAGGEEAVLGDPVVAAASAQRDLLGQRGLDARRKARSLAQRRLPFGG